MTARFLGQDVSTAVRLLRAGKLVAFPTETVYGLGALACDDRAVARVFAAKGRPSFNPLIVHGYALDQLHPFGHFGPEALTLAQAFWPGPLTLVVALRDPPLTGQQPLSRLALAGLSSVAMRVPSHPLALDLLKEMGAPLVAPSANPSGYVSPTTAAHVMVHLKGRIAGVLDGGACRIGLESTVVSCLDSSVSLLRAGAIAVSDLETCLGRSLASKEDSSDLVRSPGQLLSHYAPRARLRLNAQSTEPGEVLLAFGEPSFVCLGPVVFLSKTRDLSEAASRLFSCLHDLDAQGVERAAVMPIPEEGLGEALNDRLRRAAFEGL